MNDPTGKNETKPTGIWEEVLLERKKKNLGCLFLLSPLLIVLLSLALWKLAPNSHWRVAVVDKTTPHPEFREHASLFWMLNHMKVPSPLERGRWRKGKDYIGYHPEKTARVEQEQGDVLTSHMLENKNLLVLADSYGVYTDDYAQEDKPHSDYSTKIYGGFSTAEAKAIEQFAERGGAILAEFNTFASPTEKEARLKLEKLLGVRWTEWTGRFFSELSNRDEIPEWARRNWQKHYGEGWDFYGPGFLLTNEDSRLFVLVSGKHLKNECLTVVPLSEDSLLKNVVPVRYNYWFDIVIPLEKTRVLAEYQFQLTEEGRRLLAQFGINPSFPSVLLASPQPICIYLAGDFSDKKMDFGPYYLWGWTDLLSFASRKFRHSEQSELFWKFYFPLVRNILKKSPSSF